MTQPTLERLNADVDALVGWVNSALADIARLSELDEQVRANVVSVLDRISEVVATQIGTARREIGQLAGRVEAMEQRAITHENRMAASERAVDEQLRLLNDTSAERLRDLHESVVAAGGKAVVRQVLRDSAGRVTGSVEVDAIKPSR